MTRWHGSTFSVRAMLRAAFFISLLITALLALASSLRLSGSRATGRIGFLSVWLGGVAAQNQNRVVTTVSAASFEQGAPVAPESIVAIFGVDLATGVSVANTLLLPTELLGTSVVVRDSAGREQLANLFFVSPGQINCLIPPGTAEGVATITVRSGKGNTETGTVAISKAAPAIFTANASGTGVPAAVALRIRSNGSYGFEGILQGSYPNRIPAAIDLGPEGESVYLVLYLCGLRFVPKTDARVLLGGSEVPPADFDFAPSPEFIGVDQLNVRLSRSLIGRGQLKLSVSAQGRVSNQIEFEIGGRIVSEAPQITAVSKTADVLAGEEIVLTGARFASNAKDNTVRFGDRPATIVSANPGQLRIRVPYGAESGPVSVITPQGEGHSSDSLSMRMTLSGIVKDTHSVPIPGVKVTLRVMPDVDYRTVTTNSEGLFFMSEVPPNTTLAFLQFDGSNVLNGIFPNPQIKMRVYPGRDNIVETPVFLLQVNGTQTQVGSALTQNVQRTVSPLRDSATHPLIAGSSVAGDSQRTDSPLYSSEEVTLTAGVPDQTGIADLKFIVPAGSTIRFPNGDTRGTLTLNAEPNGLTPVPLPPDNFVSVIAQIAFFGATLNPGGKLIFPNTDNLPVGTPVRLFRYDVNSADSPWVDTKDAVTITASGIETSVNAVKQTTYYFVTAQHPVTTAVGRVIEDNGTPEGRPVAGATVRIHGQEAVTDGNGGFVLRGVIVTGDGSIFAEVNLLRASGQVTSKQSNRVSAIINGLTNLGAIVLASDAIPNRPPTALIPASITVNAGEQFDQPFTASDPDPGQSVSLQISDTRLAEIISRGGGAYTLRLKPALNDANSVFKLVLTVTDNLGKSQSFDIAVIVRGSLLANSQSVTTDEDTPVAIRLSGSDPAGRPLTYQIVSQPGGGRLSGTVPNLTYTPDANYNGSDSFTFKVNNGVVDSNVATVSIAINPVNDAPVLTVPGAQTVTTGQSLSFTITASDVDAGQTLTLSTLTLPTGATFTQTSATSGQFSWTPSTTQVGNYAITLRVADNGSPSLGDSKNMQITVDGQWQPTGDIEGGVTPALLLNGGNLYAGTANSLYRSTNQAQTWSIASNGLGNLFVTALAESGSTIYASVSGAGVYRSTDQGQNWIQVGPTLPNPNLAVRSQFGLGVSGTTVFVGTDDGVYRYVEGSLNWTAFNNGLTGRNIQDFAFVGTTAFVATFDKGVFRLDGERWTSANAELPGTSVTDLAVSGNSVYVALPGQGIFRSDNNGQNWTPLSSGLPSDLDVVSVTANGSTLYAGTNFGGTGVFRSTNGGQTWARLGIGLPPYRVHGIVPSGANIFAATQAGIYSFNNARQLWEPANTGMKALGFFAMAQSGRTLLTGSIGGGVFRSDNDGQRWDRTNTDAASDFYDLKTVGSIFFAAAVFKGVLRSIDQGLNWTPVNTDIVGDVYSLGVMGTTLFAGTREGEIFRSTNQGLSWTKTSLSIGTPVWALVTDGSTLYAVSGGEGGKGIFRSDNQGQTWVAMNTGLTNLDVRALAAKGNALFAGTYFSGIFRSDNAGQSWTTVNNGLSNLGVEAFAISGETIFAGTNDGVFRSDNNGQSWRAVNVGIAQKVVLDLLIVGNKLYACTAFGSGGGVYVLQF